MTASACCTAAWPLVSAAISCQLKGSREQPSGKKGGTTEKKMKGKTYRRSETHTDSHFHSRPPATVCFHKSRRNKKNGSRRIVFQSPVNKVGIDLIAHVIRFAV